MTLKKIPSFAMAAALVLLCHPALHAEEDDGRAPLEKTSAYLPQIAPLTFGDGRIKIDKEAWAKIPVKKEPEDDEQAKIRARHSINEPPVGTVYKKMIEEIGGGGGGGSSSGSTQFEWTRYGTILHSRLKVNTAGEEFAMRLEERKGPRRALTIENDLNAGFTIRMTNPSGNNLLLFQARDGKSVVMGFDGNELLAAGAINMGSLFSENEPKLKTFLRDPLTAVGVTLPAIPAQAPAVEAPKVDSNGPGILAKTVLGLDRLLPLALNDGRLAIDVKGLKKLDAIEDKNREESKEVKRRQTALRLGIPPDQVPEHMLKVDDRFNRNPEQAVGILFKDMTGVHADSNDYFGWRGGNSYDNDVYTWTSDVKRLTGSLTYGMKSNVLRLRLQEPANIGRSLVLEQEPGGEMLIQWTDVGAGELCVFLQSANGKVGLVCFKDGKAVALNAASFPELMAQNAGAVEDGLIKPLTRLGMVFPMDPLAPAAVAVATTGFGAPSPSVEGKVKEELAKLGSDEQDVRESATSTLIELYPFAVGTIEEAATKSPDAEVKTRLQSVMKAHPNIGRARPFVESKKLHTDTKYLLGVLSRDGPYKASARKRLGEIHGKDHGDDPGAWPK